MRRSFLQLLIASLGLTLAGCAAVARTPPPKVLMVVSSHGSPSSEGGQARPGYDLREFGMAWSVLRANGLQVEVASPKGGAVEADPYKPEAEFVRPVLTDATVMRQLRETLPTARVNPQDYAAVLVIGGKGPMFDLHADAGLQALLRSMHERDAVIAAVCHGPAALLNVTLANGQPLLQGRRVTAISKAEDRLFAKKWFDQFPFQLEDALRDRGARYERAPLMMPKLVVDGRLITGQNPLATPLVAEAVVRALGRVPVSREPYLEERTMALVQRHLDGDVAGVREQLQREPGRYKIELVGFYGHLLLQDANDAAQTREALMLMQTAALHVQHPELLASIARAEQMLKQSSAR